MLFLGVNKAVGHIVKTHPDGYIIYVEEGETILDAALKQAYDFPFNCQSGICSTCKGRVLSGDIDYLGIEPEGLEPNEQELGYALFCSASPKSDLIIEVPELKGPEIRPEKQLNYHLEKMTPLSDTVYQVILNPPEDTAIEYLPGQYIMLGNSTGEMRPYSIANAPSGGHHLELHIRHTPDNKFTSQLTDLNSQKPVPIKGPYGRCIFHYIPTHPIIFMAGGTGFSQSKALIEYIIALMPESPIHLFWVAKTSADLYLSNLAEAWVQKLPNFKFTPILSNPKEGWLGCTQRIEKAVIDTYPDLSNHVVYASGPQDMVFTALYDFEKCGLEKTLMFSDAFSFV